MNTVAYRINRLASVYNLSNYLEIGVYRGNTFRNVKMPHKTAVDPKFMFDVTAYDNKTDEFYFMQTSDEFFANREKIQRDYYRCHILYDIIYIDGLHSFKQAMRDFTNSLPFTHDRTIWIFDDTIPSDPYSAYPNQEISYILRKQAGSDIKPWHGDVFKCLFALHDFYPDISYATVYDNGNPQTVCWRTNWPAKRTRLFNNLEDLENMSYFDFLDRCYVCNLTKDCNLESMIGTQFVIQDYDAQKLWPLLVHKFV